ncbi:phosphotransferase family protein [Amycolatopsis methanolica]|uniref:phosphotransferase family protein n=1 Tax=Amycolatopsis methanolica TaxID=1814 RepID=UPI00341F1802
MAENASLTERGAHQALASACVHVGLDPEGAELIRIGSNAVFQLRTEPVIVRIRPDFDDAMDSARRQVAVARWLEAEAYPATRALHVEQPIATDGRVVTFWESASERGEYAPLAQVGALIRRLHELKAPASLHLTDKRPIEELDHRLEVLKGDLDESDAAFLGDCVDDLRSRYRSLNFVLAPGVIHGDANVGNVIFDRNGNVLLIDLDSFAIGPREWDLVQTALFYERFGWHTEEEYRQFVEVYGWGIMSWPGYPVLADYREVAMTLWLARKAGTDERAAAEVRKRVAAIRTGGDRRDWAPF